MNKNGTEGLPPGWADAVLEDFCLIIQGQSPPGETYNTIGEGLPFFQGKAEFGDIYPTPIKWCSAPTKIAEPDDILISIRAPVGPTNLCPAVSCIGRGLAAVRSLSGIPPKYVLYVLRNTEEDLASKGTGSTFAAISGSNLRAHQLPLAPLPEQHRIVAEIEKQFTRLDAAVAALERARANLKRYRASVLKAACEGRLVPTESELACAEGRDYESANRLLARLLKERRAKWEAYQLAKIQAQGKVPKDDKWKAKYQEPVPPDTTNLPELPEGWVWASPEQLSSSNDYSLAIGPFGSNLKVSDYTDEGVPLIFVRNIRSQTFGGKSTSYISREKAEELRPHWVSPGDILVTKMGDPPGDACLYPTGKSTAVITADCIKFRLCDLLSSPVYFVFAINSQVVCLEILAITKGVAQLKVSLGRFKTIGLPLPPLAEQFRIVTEVERRLSVIDELEATVDTNLKRAERLRQSILKRAFEGKLVPQNPNDESARVLLERIRAERAGQEAEQKATRKATGKPDAGGKRPQVLQSQGELF